MGSIRNVICIAPPLYGSEIIIMGNTSRETGNGIIYVLKNLVEF